MWLLDRQVNSILEGCGIRPAGDVPDHGGPGRYRFHIGVAPHEAAIRLALRPAGASAVGSWSVEVDPREPVAERHVRELLVAAGLANSLPAACAPLAALAASFARVELLWIDAELAIGDAGVAFASARVLCDDNATFRNDGAAALVAGARPGPVACLKALGIDYVELDGTVGLLSVGAGETMAAMDLLAASGCRAACFLDLSGGFGVDAVTAAFRQVAALPRVRSVLVNVFGGLTRVDRVAESIVAVLEAMGSPPWPVVVRLEGTEAERGRALVTERGFRCERTLRGAIAAAVTLASGGVA